VIPLTLSPFLLLPSLLGGGPKFRTISK
jgi:hypothetical protein